MASAMTMTLDLVADGEGLETSDDVGAAFLAALEPLGASSLWARQFHLTPKWVDPKVNATYKTYNYACIRDANWWGSQAQRYSDTVCPVSIGATRFARPYFCSEVTRGAARQYGAYWEAMAEFGVSDTLAVPYFGPHNTAAGITIWFKHRDFSPEETIAIRMAGTLTLERMRCLKAPLQPLRPPLTARERECLAFVSEGKSDWEISMILNIAQGTVHQHIENAKRKLGVRTRAHAVARHLAFDPTFSGIAPISG